MEKLQWWQSALIGLIIGLIAGVLIGMAIGWRWAGSVTEANGEMSGGPSATSTENGGNGSQVLGDARVVASDQPAGRAVVVSGVTLPQTGWIAVHEIIAGEGTGNVLGAARRDAGSHENVVVNLLRGTEPANEYAVVLYADNGNREFDLKADLPIADEHGNPVTARFSATTPTGAAGQ